MAPQSHHTTNDDESMIRVALHGVGIIQHLDIAVNEYIAKGTLQQILEGWCTSFSGFYLYIPSRAHLPIKVRVLMDFLIEKRGLL